MNQPVKFQAYSLIIGCVGGVSVRLTKLGAAGRSGEIPAGRHGALWGLKG